MNDKIPIRRIIELIEQTVSYGIDWVCISVLKDYLRGLNLSLNDISVVHSLLGKFQADRFIFDCNETYLGCYSDGLYMLSKSKYSLEHRLDVILIKDEYPEWRRLKVNTNVLLRLRNAILATNSGDNCEELLNSISLDCSA